MRSKTCLRLYAVILVALLVLAPMAACQGNKKPETVFTDTVYVTLIDREFTLPDTVTKKVGDDTEEVPVTWDPYDKSRLAEPCVIPLTGKTGDGEVLAGELHVVGKTMYLSDYYYTTSTIHGSAVMMDCAVGGGDILLGGTSYDKGVGMHTGSNAVYELKGAFDTFSAVIGISGAADETVYFCVEADYQEIYRSPPISGADDPLPISVDVSGCQKMTLYVEKAVGKEARGAVWADAQLLMDESTVVRDIKLDGQSLPYFDPLFNLYDYVKCASPEPEVEVTPGRPDQQITVTHGTDTDGFRTVKVEVLFPDTNKRNVYAITLREYTGTPEDDSWKALSGEYYDWTLTKEPEEPYSHDYSQSMCMKLYICHNSNVRMTFAQTLETIKKIDKFTLGISKIIYLVGWQYEGHDARYPSWDTVNVLLKRPEDATGLDSLKWLMEEAKQYNTTVSLHINLNDAAVNSPLFNVYRQRDVLSREANGQLSNGGLYAVSLTKEWESGLMVERINRLLAMLPLAQAGTVHIDAFFPYGDRYAEISKTDDMETMRKIYRYFRSKGIDVTSEQQARLRSDPFIGLQPNAFWFDLSEQQQLEIPATLACGGIPYSPNDEDIGFLFGINMQGERTIGGENLTAKFGYAYEADFLEEFCLTTLPFTYQNRFDRLELRGAGNDRVAVYSDGLELRLADRSMVKNGQLMRIGNDVFIPALWVNDKTIITFSKNGYSGFTWSLPQGWDGVTAVDIYLIEEDGGYKLLQSGTNVVNRTITLSLDAGRAAVVVPAGAGM